MTSNYFRQYIAGYTVANFWRYPIKRRARYKSKCIRFLNKLCLKGCKEALPVNKRPFPKSIGHFVFESSYSSTVRLRTLADTAFTNLIRKEFFNKECIYILHDCFINIMRQQSVPKQRLKLVELSPMPDGMFHKKIRGSFWTYYVVDAHTFRVSRLNMLLHSLNMEWICSYKKRRRQRSGIDTIDYHTWPLKPYVKVTTAQENITHKTAKRSVLSKQVIIRLQGTDKTVY